MTKPISKQGHEVTTEEALASSAAAQNTDSGTSEPHPGNEPAAEKLRQSQVLAASMPFNPLKASEHGFENGLNRFLV